MWCWHRIRESESGLCPACRTPYGDDPHQFSAVDVDEVLKANKEKEAAAKRERDRLRQQSDSNQHASDAETIAALTSGKVGQMEVPADRSMLANMRVIRRNLVYAVGLAPSIAQEEILRKSAYFGQYGRIAKIVLNRNQTTASGDTRRASASAYVTFVHKEDTLSCILALDGFYLDGRNIRASYGTSKYCSAFIKNMRCNNPDCTYLHEMGYIEDTFTKQEIQAGYVTSGRDVLARQQQIMAQALASVSGNGSTPRRKVGGGGPSGTGRASASPVFPPPTFDEPQKPQLALVPPPPSASAIGRSITTGSGFPPISSSSSQATTAANGGTSTVSSAKLARSSSAGAKATVVAPPTAPPKKIPPKTIPAAAAATSTKKKAAPTPAPAPAPAPPAAPEPSAAAILASAPSATAASVVAGSRGKGPSVGTPSPHSTLTQLTPLKRASVAKNAAKSAQNTAEPDNPGKFTSLRPSANKKNAVRNAVSASTASLTAATVGSNANTVQLPAPVASSNQSKIPPLEKGPSSIGGTVIAAPNVASVPIAPMLVTPNGLSDRQASTGLPTSSSNNSLGGLGGEVFNGPLETGAINRPSAGSGNAIGIKDKWNSTPIGGDPVIPAPSSGLWGSQSSAPNNGINGGFPSGSGGGIIGGGNSGGSSALASMLGINLPTGSGSLRDWGDVPADPKPSLLTTLNGTFMPVQGLNGTVIGQPSNSNGTIGGVTIGNPTPSATTSTIGGNSGNSDIALLQSLLPGVHVTSGGPSTMGLGGGNSWNSGQRPIQRTANTNMRPAESIVGSQWPTGNRDASIIGTIGQPTMKRQQPQQQPSHGNIW